MNPMHHTNSSAITDWALRRPHSFLIMVEKYSTNYWAIVANVHTLLKDTAELSNEQKCRIVMPLVSKHIDFLDSLESTNKLPDGVTADALRESLSHAVLLLGSAPVGPSTVKRLQQLANAYPVVRYGCTEATLQSCGIPLHAFSDEQMQRLFERGWHHSYTTNGVDFVPCCGYYIGQQHCPYTEIKIVKSVELSSSHYLEVMKRIN